mgnify:FL=1
MTKLCQTLHKNFTAFLKVFLTLLIVSFPALAQDADCEVTKEMGIVPDELYVEIYPVIITSIDEIQESFDYQFYLGYSFEIDDDLDYCFFETQDLSIGIFDPRFEFMNAIDVERITPFNVEFEDDEVYVDTKYKGTFKGKFDFTLYPFDAQNLHVDISSTYSTDDFKIYIEDQDNSLLDDLSVRGWDKIKFSPKLDKKTWDGDDEEYEVIQYTITLDRQVLSISLRLFLPLLVIVSLNFLSLVLERNDFETKVEIQLAALIAVAAYSILMDTKIPDLPYITLADTVIAFSFITSALILAISILKKRKRDRNTNFSSND